MHFTTDDIREHVGASSFAKGREYFTQGKVTQVKITEDTVSGKVMGSGRSPYKTEFFLEDGEITDSNCSCPVSYACKHVAAMGLQALIELAKTPQVSSLPPDIPFSRSVETLKWIETLSTLLKDTKETEEKQFALQILVNIEQAYSYEFYSNFLLRQNWQTNKKTPLWKIVMRPRVYDPETGGYSVSHIAWDRAYNSVSWNGKQGKLSEKQYTYLQLLKEGLAERYAKGWTKIADEKAAYVWHILKEHESYGVTLLAGQKGQLPITLTQEPLEIKLAIRETKNGLVIEKKIVCAGEDITQKQVAFAGDPPRFAAILEKEMVKLHPVDARASRAAYLNEKIAIPSQDTSLLNQKFLPELAKQYSLETHTKNIHVPKTITLQPSLSVRHIKKQIIAVRFGFTHEKKTYSFSAVPDVITDDAGASFIPDQQSIKDIQQTIADALLYDPAFAELQKPLQLSQDIRLDGIHAARFVVETIPKLQTRISQLLVHVPPELPKFYFDTSEAQVDIRIEENSDEHDWFDLGITVSVGSEKVAFHQLFSALVEEQEYLLLESGRYFPLNTPQFTKLKELIGEAKSLREKTTDGLSISRFQAGLWDELQRLGVVTEQTKRWQDTMQGLLVSSGVELQSVPTTVKATLRQYQIEGFSWLHFLHTYQLGGILADDMGLGKTIQTIAFMAANKQKGKPFLVIAPTSVVENWDTELYRFCPTLKKVVLRAGDRTKQLQNVSKADVVILSYALLIRDFEKLKQHMFNTIILDEAQMVKNYQSKAYAHVRKLKVESKIALSGTPMENNLMELWSLFSIVAPGLFPSPKQFQTSYRTPIEKQQNQEMLAKLRSRIRPFMLRRQKAIVEKQLPAKNEQVLHLPLNKEHRHIYDLHLQQERKRVLGLLQSGGLQSHRFEILKSLTKMRQLCLHPGLVDTKYKNFSATKLEALSEYLEGIIAEKHRVLIFSQFTSFLAQVKTVLEKADYPYLYLAGETKNRGSLLKEFQENDSIPIFLISLKAGGFGLNLTAADYCIILDPWWNPAAEQQAIDRTHRIGQTKTVFVYKFIIKDTIEEKVLKLQEKKQKLFKNIMDDESFFSAAITEEDIKNIFT